MCKVKRDEIVNHSTIELNPSKSFPPNTNHCHQRISIGTKQRKPQGDVKVQTLRGQKIWEKKNSHQKKKKGVSCLPPMNMAGKDLQLLGS